jgi:TldD protein
MPPAVDDSFLALPLRELTAAALTRAGELGARHTSVRIDRVRKGTVRLRDAVLEGSEDGMDTGLAVRVRHGGAWGFAATAEPTQAAALACAERAVQIARHCSGTGADQADLADEPVHHDATWVSGHQVNPFAVPEADRTALLADWSRRLLAAPEVVHVLAQLSAVQENKFYADQAGTCTTQQRVWLHPMVLAVGRHRETGALETLRSTGPPSGRGWEYVAGSGWDWDGELAELPWLLAEKLRAPRVEPGSYDLVIDPSNLWLTIHESVGHATELDRALGHEAGYAGTTFATPDLLGTLRFGSELMNVTGDRTAEHGLATIGFDDEGVAAQSWELVTEGVLTGFQSDRRTAGTIGAGRSNGCAHAESGRYAPLSRMPNVSLRPAEHGPGLEDLIGGVTDGIYLAGSGSWSIDMQRHDFQFTAQHCHRIRSGRLAGQLRNVAYQGTTGEFWGSLCALGGPDTYRMFGADLCGKGQPVQISAAGHGCPPAVFERVRVVDASLEAGP